MTETTLRQIDSSMSLGLLDRVAEFLRSVSAQDLNDLSEGKAWITVGRPGDQHSRKPKPRKTIAAPRVEVPPSPETEAVITTLRAAETPERGLAYLESLNLGKPRLQDVMKALRQRGYSKDNMSVLRAKIVRATIGATRQAEALRGL